MTVKRLARDALLAALALIIFIVELQLPELTPIPGIKPGLSNSVTVAALFLLGPGDAAMILLTRILLGSLFAASPSALIYSLAGGTLSFLVMLALRRVLAKKQLWAASAVGACFHNLGQLTAAVLITGSPALWAYLPVLTVSGILTGTLTGLAALFAANRLSK